LDYSTSLTRLASADDLDLDSLGTHSREMFAEMRARLLELKTVEELEREIVSRGSKSARLKLQDR